MRELTFRGYLLSQLQNLSDLESTSMYSFSKLACDNARLRNVLCLFLVLFTEDKLRNRLLKKYHYLVLPCKQLEGLSESNLDNYMCSIVFSEYKTIYENYLYHKGRKNQEDKIKLMMYNRICEFKKVKGITNYQIYKELELNHGNINAFLKNGDVTKVGLNTVRKILDFVNSYKPNRTA